MREVLLTGASKGVGLAIARHLLEEGNKVIGISRSLPSLCHPLFTPCLCDLNQIEKNVDSLLSEYNNIDTLICNAGFGRFGSLEEFSFQQMKEQMQVNFLSHAYLTRALIPKFKKNKKGTIIFIGSEAALEGKRKGTMYCASKFAMRGFAQALRDECSSHGISVTLIHPGMIANTFYHTLPFKPGDADHEHIKSEDIAELIASILKMRPGTVIDEITLSPQTKKISFS